MPEEGDQVARIDPYLHSIQWSRRFNGLKIFLPLATHGWKGYSTVISNQIRMGDHLRKLLIENGWEIMNTTKLPVICFTHPGLKGKDSEVTRIVDRVVQSGKAWVSTYPIHNKLTIRACVINYATTEEDLHILIDDLNEEMESEYQ